MMAHHGGLNGAVEVLKKALEGLRLTIRQTIGTAYQAWTLFLVVASFLFIFSVIVTHAEVPCELTVDASLEQQLTFSRTVSRAVAAFISEDVDLDRAYSILVTRPNSTSAMLHAYVLDDLGCILAEDDIPRDVYAAAKYYTGFTKEPIRPEGKDLDQYE